MAQFSAEIPKLQWKSLPRGQEFAIPAASLVFATTNATVRGTSVPVPPSLRMLLRDAVVASTDGHVQSSGNVTAIAQGSLTAADAKALVSPISAVGAKPEVVRLLAAALTNLNFAGRAAWNLSGTNVRLTWTDPITLESANGFVVHFLPLARTGEVQIDSSGVAARFTAIASGAG